MFDEWEGLEDLNAEVKKLEKNRKALYAIEAVIESLLVIWLVVTLLD